MFAGVPCEAGVVAAVMCERSLAHWCLRLACWVRVVRGAACLLGSAVVVVPEGWLCASRGWHIVGVGCVAWWERGFLLGCVLGAGCWRALCVSGGWHIVGVGGWMVLGLACLLGSLCGGFLVPAMCEPWLAHSRRWLCCVVGAWLFCWVVFLARGVGGRYVRVVAVTLGVLVGWMDLGSACLLGFLARLALLWRLCVSGGWHIARGIPVAGHFV
ncbi:hypothetical protein CLV65_1344 [Pseudoscardovia suis]|uniref:Uncharacterized protein n=1 Tax=Pseudoscardovia suis TaxID=987063 RepID=A0A261F4B1_9BIFI|nr:hypothetical protein PSSU_0082 [Pseudoscardovia suis]PJJ65782.1 hypothetical protein CLV65_1344 [Pseudoscardovia suis]